MNSLLRLCYNETNSTRHCTTKLIQLGKGLMSKNVKLIMSLALYAIILCISILLISRIFNSSAKQEYTGEVVYESIELSAPLYPSTPGNAVADNKFVNIDFSNSSQGYISVRYKGDSEDAPVLKVNYGETEYTYILEGEDIFPLTCGDGIYTIRVYKQLPGGKYKSVINKTLTVELENQLLPYLYPSQLVKYTDSSITVQHSDSICDGIDSDLEKLKTVYNYIISNITYDYIKAANIERGYIPSVDSTYITKTGICFDYSVMLATMLRAQRIPVKLVMGYLNGTAVFHAWNEVYLKDRGWVTVGIYIDMQKFTMLDTTLASSQSDEVIAQKLKDPAVYMPTLRY